MKDNKSILIVDDEVEMRISCRKILEYSGYTILEAKNGIEALRVLESHDVDLVLVDLRMSQMNGLELMEEIRRRRTDALIIVISAFPTIENAIETTKQGAFDFLVKPFSQAQLEFSVTRAFAYQRLVRTEQNLLKQLQTSFSLTNIIGSSHQFRQVMELVRRAAKSDTNVLLVGESGTGKELIARYIHAHSLRKRNPFVAVDCCALPESLVESELFGYEKGAFTGANSRKIGLFEHAHSGTFFLDEICEIPLQIQVKLLRTLQEKKFRRLGGDKEIFSDFRVISATNRDIEDCLRNNTLREDLYYRLSTVTIKLPPLRERKGDIPLLTKYFIKKYSPKINPLVKEISPEALKMLENYSWPGNVRELENLIQSILVMTDDEIIDVNVLPEKIRLQSMASEVASKNYERAKKTVLEEFKRNYFLRLLEKYEGNVTKTATAAGVSRKTIQRFIKKFSSNNPKVRH